MSIVILDLDNTISDDGWRIPKIKWDATNLFDRYHDYHGLGAYDNSANKHLFEDTPHEIVIFTARPTHYRAPTEEWLRINGIRPIAVVMRHTIDHSTSVDLKRKQLGWFCGAYNKNVDDIVCAYDDLDDVISMYLAAGLKAEKVIVHNKSATQRPKGDFNGK